MVAWKRFAVQEEGTKRFAVQEIDLVMAGREEESTHEIALSGDVNELVEEMDGLEVVDDDDENSDDEIDGDD